MLDERVGAGRIESYDAYISFIMSSRYLHEILDGETEERMRGKTYRSHRD
jgi:hypothetical protein